MRTEERVRLWDAINRYVKACGGNPGRFFRGNIPRMNAVADVEQTIREIERRIREGAP